MSNGSLPKLKQFSSDMSQPRSRLDIATHILIERHLVHGIHNNDQMPILTTISKRAIAMAAAFRTNADLVLVTALDGVADVVDGGRKGDRCRSVRDSKVVGLDFLCPLGRVAGDVGNFLVGETGV